NFESVRCGRHRLVALKCVPYLFLSQDPPVSLQSEINFWRRGRPAFARVLAFRASYSDSKTPCDVGANAAPSQRVCSDSRPWLFRKSAHDTQPKAPAAPVGSFARGPAVLHRRCAQTKPVIGRESRSPVLELQQLCLVQFGSGTFEKEKIRDSMATCQHRA